MHKPYVIVTPDYDPTSGGIKVMWGLYGWLLSKGVEVYINRKPPGETIAIYPEIYHGNPVDAFTVVRYLLNIPGVMASRGVPGPTSFGPYDRLYYFSRLFGDTDDRHYLFLPIINLHIFKDQHKKRTKTAVFVGKGQDLHQHPKDSIYITRDFARNQSALADLLNECTILYGYDPVSAMYECSRLCGCPVILQQSQFDKGEWAKYEPGTMGISWGTVEQNHLDTEAFREHYVSLIKTFESKLELFIEDTQL